MTRQQTIPGTAPVETHPEIRLALDEWLEARDAALVHRKRVAEKQDALLDAIAASGLAYYTYDLDGKRRRVYPTATPRLKTEVVGPSETSNEGRKVRRGEEMSE